MTMYEFIIKKQYCVKTLYRKPHTIHLIKEQILLDNHCNLISKWASILSKQITVSFEFVEYLNFYSHYLIMTAKNRLY
jgi:hypothetical protein